MGIASLDPATAAGATSLSQVPGLLLVLILAISAFIQFTVVSKTVVELPLRNDAGEYFSYAYNLHQYGTYSLTKTWIDVAPAKAPIPDSIRPPGYSIFLLMAGAPRPNANYLLRVSYLQAALGVLSVWLIYLIAVPFLGRGFSLLAALLTATAPNLAMISTYLLSESLFTFMLLASVLTLTKAVQSGRLTMFAATGAVWGICSLVRPTAQFFPVLCLLVVLVSPSLRRFKAPALLAFACFVGVLSPWIVRNLSPDVLHPRSSLMVKTFAHGSYPGFMYEGRPETFAYPYRFDPKVAEITRDLPSVLKDIGRRFIEKPAVYTHWYLLGKPYFFLSLRDVQSTDIMIFPVLRTPFYQDLRFSIVRRVSLALHWPVMVLGLVGALLLALRPQWLCLDASSIRTGRVVALLIGYAIVFHMIAAPFPRYAIPFRPLIYALAALPISAAWFALRRLVVQAPGSGSPDVRRLEE